MCEEDARQKGNAMGGNAETTSVAIHVHNQRGELFRFLEELQEVGFNDELLVVVLGGEDPFDLLNLAWSYSIKALYLEKRPCKEAKDLARAIAESAAQGSRFKFLDVTKPLPKNIHARFGAPSPKATGGEEGASPPI